MANSLAELETKVSANTSSYEASMDGLPADADRTVEKVESRFDKLAPALGEAGKVAGAALGAAMITGAVQSMEEGAASGKLAAQLNLDPGEQEQAGKIAGAAYYGGYGDSLEQVNDAVAGVVTGLADLDDAAGVERLTTKALDVADAFDRDVTGAVQEAKILMGAGLAADADEAFDLIVAGAQSVGPALKDEIGDAVTEYSGAFAQIGMDGEAMYGLLAQADDQFELDKIGDSIKELTIRGTDMSDTSVAAYEAAGLSATKMADDLLAGGDRGAEAFDKIVGGLASIEDPVTRANSSIALFGTPLEDMSTAQIPAFLEQLQATSGVLGDVEGRADSMGDALNTHAKQDVKDAQRAVEGWVTSLVTSSGPVGDVATGVAGLGMALEPVGPAIAGVGLVFRDQLGSMATSMASRTGSMISTGATWSRNLVTSAATGAAGIARSGAVIIGTYVKLAAQAAVQGAKGAAATAVSTAKMIGHYAKLGVQSLLHAAKVAASWVIAMGPVGWVIAGVVGLVALIVANWDKVSAWTRRAWDAVGQKVASVWRWVVDTATSAGSRVVGFIRDLPGRFMSGLASLGTTVASFVARYHPVAILARKAAELWPDFYGWLRDLPGRIVSAVGNLGSKLSGAGRDLVRGLWDGISGMGRWLADRVASFVTDRIPGPIARALGISSPSKVAAGLAREVPRGLIVGVEAEASKLQRASEEMAMRLLPDLGVPTVPSFNGPDGPFGPDGAAAGGGGSLTVNANGLGVDEAAREIGDRLEARRFLQSGTG